MKIMICEDEPKMAENIQTLAEEYSSGAETKIFLSGEELLAGLSEDLPEVVLLDIDLPGISGLEVAGRMSEAGQKCLLVFVTAHDEFVYDSLKYHPFAFVRKNYLREELREVLADCEKEIGAKEKHFHFRFEGGDVFLPIGEICYFEAEGNYLAVHTKETSYRFRSTLTMVENALEQEGFLRIHKGFLVNQAYVLRVEPEKILLESKEELPLGKAYAKDARERILKYMRE